MNAPTMLTIRQVAEKVNLPEHYIRQLCINGKIVCCRAGNKYLINYEKFIEHLNTGENGASV